MLLGVFSGGVTLFTILMGFSVLLYWRKATAKAITQNEALSSEQWLILGVTFGFIGQVLDNMYWLITWSVEFIQPQSELSIWLFDNGMLFNLPFRQILGSLAAFFHVKAAIHLNPLECRYFKNFVYLAAVLSSAFAVFLAISYVYANEFI